MTNLKAKGLAVWFDQAEIPVGASISQEMSQALGAADKLLVAWSTQAQASQHVWNELDAFYIRKPAPEFILFLRLDETPIPKLYAARRYLALVEARRAAVAILTWATGRPTADLQESEVAPPTPEILKSFPRGPRVEGVWITASLVSAYAGLLNNSFRAQSLIESAIRLRRDADSGDPRVTAVELRDLPNLNFVGAECILARNTARSVPPRAANDRRTFVGSKRRFV